MKTAQEITQIVRTGTPAQVSIAITEITLQRDILLGALASLQGAVENAEATALHGKGEARVDADIIRDAESALAFVRRAESAQGEGFEPYPLPCGGDGPIDRPGRDICFAILGNGVPQFVTPQIIGAAAWLLSWGELDRKERQQLLDDLGAEVREGRMGGRQLVPKHLPK